MKGLRRSNGKAEASVEGRIDSVLKELAPMLRLDHCQLTIEEFVQASGKLRIRIEGTCPDCLGSPAMFGPAIEAHIRQRVPEVRSFAIA